MYIMLYITSTWSYLLHAESDTSKGHCEVEGASSRGVGLMLERQASAWRTVTAAQT